MTYERADAITIRRVEYSETSYVVTFYTREFGRLAAIAKGAKRKSSKVIGHIDLLAHAEIVFAAAGKSDRLHILAEANAAETFPGIRKELPRYYAACHAAELVHSMTAAEDPSPELFDRFLDLLRRLDQGVGPAVALYAFEAHLLVLCGFMPELLRCVSCGKATREKQVSFSAVRGGILCAECAPAEPARIDGVPAGALSLLHRLAQGKLTRLERISVSPQAAKQMRAFLDQYESHVLGRELRTAGHL